MGKRSDFERIEKDYYRTIDERAVKHLLPHLKYGTKFYEPFAGDGILTDQLVNTNFLTCTGESDLEPHNDRIKTKDVLELVKSDLNGADYIISNPPWSRALLHPMIMHLKDLAPCWLLFDADWSCTKQAIPYMQYCSDIVVVGRLRWIPNTTMSGKDNCCFYRFQAEKVKQTIFHPKIII